MLTLLSRAFLADVSLFAIIWAWFGLFSLRDLLFFMTVHGLLVMVPYIVWRLYKPMRIPYAIAWTRVYLELFNVRAMAILCAARNSIRASASGEYRTLLGLYFVCAPCGLSVYIRRAYHICGDQSNYARASLDMDTHASCTGG